MFADSLTKKATELLAACRAQKIMLATAESCTGGLIAALLTEIAGSSDVFDRGFVTYSNQAKQDMLGIDMALIETHGAVSAETARAMAEGAVAKSRASLAISVTGIAGPGGGTERKPVGLVYIGIARKNEATCVKECHFTGNRQEIRLAAVAEAIALTLAGMS